MPRRDDFISKHFDCIDYPDPVATMMEPGILQRYVSSTFLNGWINYVTPIKAFLITRYRPHSQNVKDLAEFKKAPPFHSRLEKAFHDDILLLARHPVRDWTAPSGRFTNEYWFFWFDRDVSDCQIGRFHTDEPVKDVIDSFAAYAEETSQELSKSYASDTSENKVGAPALEIGPSFIRGWVSFF